MKLEFSRQIFTKYSDIKFHENPSCGSQVVPRRQMDGQTDMKLVVVFDNFANAPKGDDVVMIRLDDSLYSVANSA